MNTQNEFAAMNHGYACGREGRTQQAILLCYIDVRDHWMRGYLEGIDDATADRLAADREQANRRRAA